MEGVIKIWSTDFFCVCVALEFELLSHSLNPGQLIFEKGTKVIKWIKDNLSTNGAGITRQLHAKNESNPGMVVHASSPSTQEAE
jgi:hypothetical protein